MIDRVIQHALNGLAYIRKNPQLLLTILLLIVIPVAFVVTSQQFLHASRANQENLERERIGILHDVFQQIVLRNSTEPTVIQDTLAHLRELNTDITAFHVLQRQGDDYVIIASLDSLEIGRSPYELEPYRISMATTSRSIMIPVVESRVRFWESYRFTETQSGGQFFIYTKTSLRDIDLLFAQRIQEAYLWLIAILLVILFLVLRHVRLTDYAYLYRETKKANAMKDLFTNMIAHELRAPLTAMRGYASLIQEHNDAPEDVRAHAEKINQSTGRLLAIVNDLLDVARIQSGRLALQPTRTDVYGVIQSVLDTLKVSAREKHIALEVDGVKQSTFLLVDEKRLFQALTNLVSNAIKYTKAGTIAVSLEVREQRVEIRVKDTGVGISAQDQKQLFAPFYRVENEETTGTVGTGLGMWITQQLIERMRGSIAVESIKGVGTHVVITLPR